ncbi:hypothetical protein SprV_0301337600 [Sparganum proliferum]
MYCCGLHLRCQKICRTSSADVRLQHQVVRRSLLVSPISCLFIDFAGFEHLWIPIIELQTSKYRRGPRGPFLSVFNC